MDVFFNLSIYLTKITYTSTKSCIVSMNEWSTSNPDVAHVECPGWGSNPGPSADLANMEWMPQPLDCNSGE